MGNIKGYSVFVIVLFFITLFSCAGGGVKSQDSLNFVEPDSNYWYWSGSQKYQYETKSDTPEVKYEESYYDFQNFWFDLYGVGFHSDIEKDQIDFRMNILFSIGYFLNNTGNYKLSFIVRSNDTDGRASEGFYGGLVTVQDKLKLDNLYGRLHFGIVNRWKRTEDFENYWMPYYGADLSIPVVKTFYLNFGFNYEKYKASDELNLVFGFSTVLKD